MGNNKSVWIGMVSVIPHEGNNDLNGSIGATVNVLCWAAEPKEYERIVLEKLNEFGFYIEDIEDIKVFDFSSKLKYKDNLRKIAQAVQKDGKLRWGTFYTYS